MEPAISSKESFHVMGVAARGNPMTMDYEDIWTNQFMRHQDHVASVSTRPECYGVYFETDEENIVDMVAGMAVPAGTEAPEGLVVREVPAATCAVFDCTLSTIAQTWGQIMGQWLPGSGYAFDTPKPAVEIYPPGPCDMNAGVQICVPVRPAAAAL